MAHKEKVSITGDWSSLTAAIQDYNLSSEYNIQVLTPCKVAFCMLEIEPTTQSYTVASQFQIVSVPSIPVGCWVRCLDSNEGTLSVEEIPVLA